MVEKAKDLVEKGEQEASLGRWNVASEHMAKAIELLWGKEDKEALGLLSSALSWKAYCDARLGRFLDGISEARRAMEIAASIGDVEGEADAMRRLGYIYWRKGDLNMALEFYNTSLEKAKASGSKGMVGLVKLDKATALARPGTYRQAEPLYREAADILLEVGNLSELNRALNNLGSCLMSMERYGEAIDSFRHCMENASRIDDVLRMGWAAMNIGECTTKMGDPEEALVFLDMALGFLEKIDDKIGIALAYLELGIAHREGGHMDKAEENLRKAFDKFVGLQLPSEEAETRVALGYLYKAKGDRALALEHFEKAREIYDGLDQKDQVEMIDMLIKGP